MRLIDADTLKAEFTGNFNELWHYTGINALIDCAPTIDPKDLRPKAKWRTLDDCSNAGVYCTRCYKKVYRVDYANQKVKSRFCPNYGAEMEGEECL